MPVGNEVYNLVVSAEDLEKRRLDRERERKLSQETNRRRKAHEDKKKLAEERENRKRELELTKRRQRQIEATERYQRSHISSPRLDAKARAMQEPFQRTLTVESVLQQLRSGDKNDDFTSVNPDTLMGRRKFENELEDRQKIMLEEHKHKLLQEFTEQLHSNSVQQQTPLVSAHIHDGSKVIANGNTSPSVYYQRQTSYDPRLNQPAVPAYHHSNVDIMSGRMYEAPDNHPQMSAPQNNSPQIDPSQQSSFGMLADSLSRLFVSGNPQNQNIDTYEQNGLKIEEADEMINDSLDGSRPQVLEYQETEKIAEENRSKKTTDINNNNRNYMEVYDDQDSLHGSSNGSSAASPRPNNYGDYSNETKKNNDLYAGSQMFRNREKTAKTIDANQPQNHSINDHNVTPMATHGLDSNSKNKTPQYKPISVSSSHSDTSLPIYKGPANKDNIAEYYVKSYRPWSATTNSDRHTNESIKRPVSAHVTSEPIKSRPKSAHFGSHQSESRTFNDEKFSMQNELNNETTAQNSAPINSTNKPRVHFEASEESIDRDNNHQILYKDGKSVKPNVKWTASPAKTTATPISAMFTSAWDNTSTVMSQSQHRSVVMLARQAMPDHSILQSKQNIQSNKDITVDEQRDIVKNNHEKHGTIMTEQIPVQHKHPVKGILRKTSKYDNPFSKYHDSHPAYQSATLAKQQWVRNINSTMQNAKLNGTPVRDSLEGNRSQSPEKNVRWHEIRYNDGTSATLGEHGSAPQPVTPKPDVQQVTAQKVQTKGKKPPAKTPAAPKAKPVKPAKGGKKGTAKGGKGRKLKVAKDVTLDIEPHPPQEVKKKQLSMSTVINYSIDGEHKPNDNGKASKDEKTTISKPTSKQNKIMFHTQSRVAWADEQNVTMDTLKSGSTSPSNTSGNVVVNQGNQVTIHVVSPERVENSTKNNIGTPVPIPLNKTPTDQEISWLWEKVRTCLNSTRNTKSAPSRLVRKSSSDTGRENYYGRKSLHTTPPQTSANIVSIDGGMLTFPGHPGVNGTTLRPNRGRRRLLRPNSANMVSNTMRKQANDAYTSYSQRGMLLQQRRQKQFGRGHRPDGIRSATYPAPKPSGYPPSPPSSGRIQPKVSDSLAAFLLAETLSEQNMSEEEITRAMDTLRRKTEEAQQRGYQVIPSSLSIEEQKLVASLERLNSRLQDVQSKVSHNPHYKTNLTNQTPWNDYGKKFDREYTYVGRGRTISADSRYRTSRIRY